MPDFIAHPYGALIAAQVLEDFRFGLARDVTLALPAIIGHSRHNQIKPVFPRGEFDLPVIRDCEADAPLHRVA